MSTVTYPNNGTGFHHKNPADDTYLHFDSCSLQSAPRRGLRIEFSSRMNIDKHFRRAVTALREGRGGGAIKRRLKPLLGGIARTAVRQPVIRRCALELLSLAPGLKPRLRRLLHAGPEQTGSLSDISPEAQRIYRRLQRQQATRKAD